MFERYTENARRVVFFSRYEASQYGSPYIETEHLLLGICRQDPALMRKVAPGLSAERVRETLEAREKISTSIDLPLSNANKRVLAYAAEEAERLSSRDIDTFHLLLGLLREKDSGAARVLNDAGVELQTLRESAGDTSKMGKAEFYCAKCAEAVYAPLTCGDCSAVICRRCGTPLESASDLGIG